MKAALKKTWENPKWNVKFLPESNKFGVKKVEDGKEWTWRGSLEVDESARTCTMTAKASTQPDEKKAKKLKDKATRPVFVLTFDADFKVLTGTLNGEAVSLEVKSKAENDDDLGF